MRRLTSSSLRLMTPSPALVFGAGRWKSAVDKEEQEEIERERKLREKFETKVGGGQAGAATGPGGAGPFKPPQSFSDAWQQIQQAAEVAKQQSRQQQQQQQQQQGAPGAGFRPNPTMTISFWDILFYSTTFYAAFLVWQLDREGSMINRFSGIHWWAEPIDVVCTYLLSRVTLSMRQQVDLKSEYERIARTHPRMTYTQFLNQFHPGIFDGYHTKQQELVAALCACFALSNDLRFAETMKAAVGRTSDVKAACDNIMDALRRDYPQVFSPTPIPPPSSFGYFAQPVMQMNPYGGFQTHQVATYGAGEVLTPAQLGTGSNWGATSLPDSGAPAATPAPPAPTA